MNANEVLTAIPVNAVLALLGTLGYLVYRDVIRRIEGLHKDAVRRSRSIVHMQSYQRLICNKLGIEYRMVAVDNDED